MSREYMDKEFPKLDRLIRAVILPTNRSSVALSWRWLDHLM